MKNQLRKMIILGTLPLTILFACFIATMVQENCLAAEEDTLSTLLLGMRHNVSSIDNVEVRFVITSRYTSEALADPKYSSRCLPEEKYEQVMVISGERYRLSGEMKHRKPEGIGKITVIYTSDGNSCRTFSPKYEHGAILVSRPSIYGFRTALDFNLGMGGRSLAEFLVGSSPKLEGLGIFKDVQCYVVSGIRKDGYKVKTWIDPNVGYGARKVEVYDNNGKLVSICEVDFKEWAGGIWFPVSGVSKTFGKKRNGERKLFVTRFLEVKQLSKQDQTDPALFTIEFPPGTEVFDESIGITFSVPEEKTEGAELFDFTETVALYNSSHYLSNYQMGVIRGGECDEECTPSEACVSIDCEQDQEGHVSLNVHMDVKSGDKTTGWETKACYDLWIHDEGQGQCKFEQKVSVQFCKEF